MALSENRLHRARAIYNVEHTVETSNKEQHNGRDKKNHWRGNPNKHENGESVKIIEDEHRRIQQWYEEILTLSTERYERDYSQRKRPCFHCYMPCMNMQIPGMNRYKGIHKPTGRATASHNGKLQKERNSSNSSFIQVSHKWQSNSPIERLQEGQSNKDRLTGQRYQRASQLGEPRGTQFPFQWELSQGIIVSMYTLGLMEQWLNTDKRSQSEPNVVLVSWLVDMYNILSAKIPLSIDGVFSSFEFFNHRHGLRVGVGKRVEQGAKGQDYTT